MKSRPYQPYKNNLVVLARSNRKNPTPAEQKMWSDILRKRQLEGIKFLRQKPIDGYIVDFYCAALGLVVEIDGDSHADKAEYDAERTHILWEGFLLHNIRYYGNTVLTEPFSIQKISNQKSGYQYPAPQKSQGELTNLTPPETPDS